MINLKYFTLADFLVFLITYYSVVYLISIPLVYPFYTELYFEILMHYYRCIRFISEDMGFIVFLYCFYPNFMRIFQGYFTA